MSCDDKPVVDTTSLHAPFLPKGSAERNFAVITAGGVAGLANRDGYRYYVGRPFTYPFDPAHDAFKAYSLPLLSVDAAGNTNGAMVFDFTTVV